MGRKSKDKPLTNGLKGGWVIGTMLFVLSQGVVLANDVQARLEKSCLAHAGKRNAPSDHAEKSCACMAQKFVSHPMATDEIRDRLAQDWNGGINLSGGGKTSGKDGHAMGVGLIVWRECAGALVPGSFGNIKMSEPPPGLEGAPQGYTPLR